MGKWLSDLDFRMMAVALRLREGLRSPEENLIQVGVVVGQVVLDYGCGVGSYTIPAAHIVGERGAVYALDKHPLAIEMVGKRAAQENLTNVKPIYSDLDTGLADQSVDVVLLYDVLHAIPDKQSLLRELGRVLKSGGILSVRPEHMNRQDFLEIMEGSGLFRTEKERGEAYRFTRQRDQ